MNHSRKNKRELTRAFSLERIVVVIAGAGVGKFAFPTVHTGLVNKWNKRMHGQQQIF